MPFRYPSMEERVFFMTVYDPVTECWEWLGKYSNRGRPLVQVRTGESRKQTTRKAAILAYEVFKGLVPRGCELHHTCRNIACINPEHLIPMLPEDHKLLHATEIP